MSVVDTRDTREAAVDPRGVSIRSEAELASARAALAHLRAGVEALRREVPNARNYAVMAEWSFDAIAKIEAEIADYLRSERLRGDGSSGRRES
jgi:hypothetical protein